MKLEKICNLTEYALQLPKIVGLLSSLSRELLLADSSSSSSYAGYSMGGDEQGFATISPLATIGDNNGGDGDLAGDVSVSMTSSGDEELSSGDNSPVSKIDEAAEIIVALSAESLDMIRVASQSAVTVRTKISKNYLNITKKKTNIFTKIKIRSHHPLQFSGFLHQWYHWELLEWPHRLR